MGNPLSFRVSNFNLKFIFKENKKTRCLIKFKKKKKTLLNNQKLWVCLIIILENIFYLKGILIKIKKKKLIWKIIF